MLNGFFDIDFQLEELNRNGDPLVKLNKVIPWEEFRQEPERIHGKDRKNNAGRKPFDAVLMFKILILQSLYNLSYDAVEYQIRDRLSFMRFLKLALDDRVPDAKTILLFREQLGELGIHKKAFAKFERYLREAGFSAKKGQIVDASIVAAPKQRNSRDENQRIKDGETPREWSENKKRQKDTEARWVKKNGKKHYGYKNHIQVDVKHKFIRKYAVTDASVHDGNVFEELLDESNSSRDVFADSAYRSQEWIETLEKLGYRAHFQYKGYKNLKLTDWKKRGNKTRAKIRARVEHVGGQAQKAGSLIMRFIGIFGAEVKIGLRNLAFNIDRLGALTAKA
jgi:IS5 family transposase